MDDVLEHVGDGGFGLFACSLLDSKFLVDLSELVGNRLHQILVVLFSVQLLLLDRGFDFRQVRLQRSVQLVHCAVALQLLARDVSLQRAVLVFQAAHNTLFVITTSLVNTTAI